MTAHDAFSSTPHKVGLVLDGALNTLYRDSWRSDNFKDSNMINRSKNANAGLIWALSLLQGSNQGINFLSGIIKNT